MMRSAHFRSHERRSGAAWFKLERDLGPVSGHVDNSALSTYCRVTHALHSCVLCHQVVPGWLNVQIPFTPTSQVCEVHSLDQAR
jgi:hypothetical protein